MYSVKNVLLKFQAKFSKNNCNFAKIELLQESFQGFLLDYHNILFREQLFMAHSW